MGVDAAANNLHTHMHTHTHPHTHAHTCTHMRTHTHTHTHARTHTRAHTHTLPPTTAAVAKYMASSSSEGRPTRPTRAASQALREARAGVEPGGKERASSKS